MKMLKVGSCATSVAMMVATSAIRSMRRTALNIFTLWACSYSNRAVGFGRRSEVIAYDVVWAGAPW